ncbi:uncharacterized protein MYCFIDRAFT_208433 [Pseudocercospora fijiensis CIRAD86]|uniref:Uncharacterized protein n=1 Tax=Pseudocercospora fijiensis (strain CIRAD86) TaxID=383855 RepID=M3ARA4_PSEFD|nr:uncharacterized protein MYCFIDRAFT_208433 [Pseudocercospora fijiensis CIRAD86]EME79967.1 hypothetical protein MYCFIDRAFT_208433 [Pseudocercospora fijiensis CIRAD86]
MSLRRPEDLFMPARDAIPETLKAVRKYIERVRESGLRRRISHFSSSALPARYKEIDRRIAPRSLPHPTSTNAKSFQSASCRHNEPYHAHQQLTATARRFASPNLPDFHFTEVEESATMGHLDQEPSDKLIRLGSAVLARNGLDAASAGEGDLGMSEILDMCWGLPQAP